MAKSKGRLFLLLRGQDDGPPETFVQVGAMRSTGMTIDNEVIDVSDKDGSQWAKRIPGGIKSMSITLTGPMSDDDELMALQAAIMDENGGDQMNFRISSGLGDLFEGSFIIKSMKRSGEFKDAEIYDISLDSADTIEYTAP